MPERNAETTLIEELVVKNLGLIKDASIQLGPGLTVVTGETGTGKTLMLGALRLLMGSQASKGTIGPHADTVDVSARLLTGESESTLRRTVDSSRSRAYLDGAVTTAAALSDATGDAFAIVGQHDQHTITSQAGLRSLVDRTLGTEGSSALERYGHRWQAYRAVLAEAEELGGDLRSLEREAEMLEFQIAEIDDAGFSVGEEVDLRSVASRLRSTEALTSAVGTALDALGEDGASASIADAARALRKAGDIDPALRDASTQIDTIVDGLTEVMAQLVRYASDLTDESADLDTVEERLALLGGLKRKYGDTIEDIVTFHKKARDRLRTLRTLLTSAEDIEERVASAIDAVRVAGIELADQRRMAASAISSEAERHLGELGFTYPVVVIDVADAEPNHHGCDTVTLRFASDRSLKPAPASAIASGGELSRLVLALTLAAGGAESDVVAFDEIDTGIGGTTALAMGAKLAALSNHRQVICVTHLPQVAAYGAAHLVVSREGTAASVNRVEGAERVAEIARMLAGLGESDTAQQHAAELLERAGA